MPKNTRPSTSGQDNPETLVLSLLSALAVIHGQTMSWYTSKKGRIWLSLKQNGAPTYSTSTELDPTSPDRSTLDALAALLAAHLPKVMLDAPPVTTWAGGTPSPDEVQAAWKRLQELAPAFRAFSQEQGLQEPPTLKAMLDDAGIQVPPPPA